MAAGEGRRNVSKAILVVLGQFTEDVEARIGREFTVRRVSSDAPTRYEDLLRAADGADAVFFNPVVKLDAEFFRRVAATVKVIATFSVGYDHIDVRAAAARKIALANTPGVLTDATADVAMLLLLGTSRRAYEAQQLVRTGAWAKMSSGARLLGWDCAGKVLGIFGMGRIGQAVARRARAFGMKIHYSNRNPLPPDVAAFFAGLGMKILDVYGMTETTGAFTANTPDEFKLGTVGRPAAGMEVRLADDGEILVRGPLTTPGYHGRPDLTRALLDAGGWLHTGDIGTIDADGFVSVTDRKKELIITAGGENIAPAAVENVLVAHPLIGQALAYGDRRPYPVALLTLDGEAAPAWARARGITAGSLAALASDPQVLAEVAAGVAAANERLARVQQVKRWRLLPVEWTAETGELTPTLKLKRRVIHAKYADVIDSLYAG